MGKTWKAAERKVAQLLDGERVGCTGKPTPDVVTNTLAVEVKHQKRLPNWLKDAVDQAEANAGTLTAVTVLHERGQRYTDALALVRLDTLRRLVE